ncbi:glutamate racemase [Sediminibacterium goheungense]|uniref:Glutamate racemase n=1 Tax=Sediminibacterium goheungense TaxID=1086393 RepID=A0A4R6IWU8_9BACT|nr:glutamate racemase [Sediminibacterium goheungense]TDO26375.1 glutamate racemase [Sediminibacterium goheungense]
MANKKPIGVFDSGYGGLTVLKEIVKVLPEYDYLYLGDNARAPYGPRSFDTVYQYTLQCVQWFFSQGCELVILACNTASAKALRTIQQQDLPKIAPDKRVLGVIRPTTEVIGNYSKTGSVGILGTNGTIVSESYPIEIAKFFPSLQVYQEACPMWVPLVENNEYNKPGADYFIQQHLHHLFGKSKEIDTILLACTHYPLLIDKIRSFAPANTRILSQGEIVANSLRDYLERHPALAGICTREGGRRFFTTDSVTDFDNHATVFYGKPVSSEHVELSL